MRAISLFSGIGGFDLGLEKAGVETVMQVEIDPHALAVLARHWPDVERVTDVRLVVSHESDRCGGADLERGSDRAAEHGNPAGDRGVDLIFGGFPCQDISVAGRRAGLSGERSGLWFEFARILEELRPRWCLIENVAGLLSSGEPPGGDLGVILDTLVELGYGVAWRTLDAQHFGVPQRRRRIFIVGCLGDDLASAAVLAVREGGGGDTQEGREAREGTTYGALSSAVTSKWSKGSGGPAGDEIWNLAPPVAHAVSASAGHHGHSSPRGDGSDNLIPQVAGALQAETYHHGGYPNQTMNGDNGHVLPMDLGVRRLTPLECERLMGFPDGWTDLPLADSHRYKQLGNAVVVPVAQWLGYRLMRVDELLR